MTSATDEHSSDGKNHKQMVAVPVVVPVAIWITCILGEIFMWFTIAMAAISLVSRKILPRGYMVSNHNIARKDMVGGIHTHIFFVAL